MNVSHTTTVEANPPSPGDEKKPGLRTKTIATRLTPVELAEIESAAARAAQPLAEWLRETALTTARRRPADPLALVLAELWAVRHLLLNVFYAGAQATAQGAAIPPESILKIRDQTDARKFEEARRMLGDFLAAEVSNVSDRS